MDRNFTNLSNVLGRPVDENISEKDYTEAVNKLLQAKAKNKVVPQIAAIPGAPYDDSLKMNRDVTNDLTRAYLNDSNPDLKLPKNNDIASKEDIRAIYDNLAKGMHNTNTTLNFADGNNQSSGTFEPRRAKEMPDLLSQQFVPNRINFSANPRELYNTPEILLHELTHAQDSKKYKNMGEMAPAEEWAPKLNEKQMGNIHDSLDATSGGHFSPEGIDNLYKYPFNQIKEQMLSRITDPANYKHFPVEEEETNNRNFRQIANVLNK